MALLTVPDETPVADFAVTTSDATFPITFSLFAKADLHVSVGGTELAQSDFTFSGTLLDGGGYDGGTVTLNTAVADTTVTIWRDVAPTRTSNFSPATSVPVRSVDTALNRLTAEVQDIKRVDIPRSVRLPVGVSGDVGSGDRANTILGFDAGGLLTLMDAAVAGLATTLSSLVTFLQAGVGAVSRSVQAKLREVVTPQDFGAVGDGVTDDTVAIQAAIDTGKSVHFPDGVYLANNLTQSTDFQRFVGDGAAFIQKNANGPLFSGSGDDIHIEGISFRGESATPAFTGDNVVLTGNGPTMDRCSSYWAYGRALKATGSHVSVLGSAGVYQTADATATGYDIEIGVSGTGTYYHKVKAVRTSQATGGFLFVDCGSQVVEGCQFGKLKIDAGTSPAGVNGGMMVGNRILGAVDVELSSAIFSANQFGAVAITFAAGTSGCVLDHSNVCAIGHTIVNSGNANNLIIRQVSAGSYPTLRFGADASYVDVSFQFGAQTIFGEGIRIPNNKVNYWNQASGAAGAAVTMSAADTFSVGNLVSGKTFRLFATGAAGIVDVAVNNIVQAIFNTSGLKLPTIPTYADNAAAVTGTLAVGQLYQTATGELRIVV